MRNIDRLASERLVLRGWRQSDADALAGMLNDAEVMHDWGGVLSRGESDKKLFRYDQAVAEFGFGRWLVESRTGEFLGYCGVMPGFPGHPLGEPLRLVVGGIDPESRWQGLVWVASREAFDRRSS